MENIALNIHRETDVLALARAEKKLAYWEKVKAGFIDLNPGGTPEYADERYKYWLKLAEKYRKRIEEHISEFRRIEDPVGFLAWISGIVATIKSILNLITR